MTRCSRLRATLPPAILSYAILLSGCASVPKEDRTDVDPWEPLNRPIFSISRGVDKVTLKPLAKGYEKVLPGPVRRGIGNFFRNIATPRSVVNNFLQGKPKLGFSELARFVFNSTLGVGGVFDVATAGGIEAHREDFGQTAAVWGVPSGPYVMLPLLGPRTLRSTILMPLDMISSPLYHYDETSVRDKLRILRLIELRARVLPAEKMLEESKDPYITLRESFLQNREFEIHDGSPPEDDEFFDEFLEEEYSEEETAGD